ncbi:MAG: CTP synthase [Candidatus Bathyarchaeota archaeon]|nr:CTP synthase [Candidatus Bathyarchaeota archaeon]
MLILTESTPKTCKYIFVTGGVLSSVGKGVVTASIGKMLQARGYSVTVIKIDPYLNVDCGTMNPYQHGEIFVTEDGGEIDLDMGHYERFLDVNLSKDQNITTGQIYLTVIERERRGEYLGRCVQIVPHITDEIKRRIYVVAERSSVDALLVEVGGTVGDIEGLPYLEAIRQIRLEKGYDNTLFVHVALVPVLDVTGEEKTKPLQHSVNELRRIGIQPDIIVARCSRMIGEEAKAKIALFGTIPREAVFCSYNLPVVYQAPIMLDEQGMGDYICTRLKLGSRKADWSRWKEIVDSMLNAKHRVKVALCGKYTSLADSYVSILEALKHAGGVLSTKVEIDLIEAEVFEEESGKLCILDSYDGVIVPPGFGHRGTEGKIAVANYAREKDIPFLGLCFGFQMAIVAFARYVCGLDGANSTENDPDTPHPVLDLMPEQRGVEYMGGSMRLGAYPVKLKPGTLLHSLYSQDIVYERHRHRWEVNPKYWSILESHGMIFSGISLDGGRIEAFEIPDLRFYVGTQYHPEFKSRPGRPSPVFYGFIKSCLSRVMEAEVEALKL